MTQKQASPGILFQPKSSLETGPWVLWLVSSYWKHKQQINNHQYWRLTSPLVWHPGKGLPGHSKSATAWAAVMLAQCHLESLPALLKRHLTSCPEKTTLTTTVAGPRLSIPGLWRQRGISGSPRMANSVAKRTCLASAPPGRSVWLPHPRWATQACSPRPEGHCGKGQKSLSVSGHSEGMCGFCLAAEGNLFYVYQQAALARRVVWCCLSTPLFKGEFSSSANDKLGI